MMELAQESDREAFARALTADGFAFQKQHKGEVFVSDPTYGPVPNLYIRRERTDELPAAAAVHITMDEEVVGQLAVSLVEIEYRADGREQSRRSSLLVVKDSEGFALHALHLDPNEFIRAGSISDYFWNQLGQVRRNQL